MSLWSWAVILFGAVLAVCGFESTAGLGEALFAALGPAAELDAPLRFSSGLMGAVSLGWGVTLLALASVSNELDRVVAQKLWARVGWAVAIWYVVDGLISALNGYALNIAPNTILGAAFGLLLWRGGILGHRPAATARA